MSLEVQVFDNLKVKEENGQVLFDAETAAIGLGISEVAKSGNTVVKWTRINKYLGIDTSVDNRIKRGDFITEPQFYKLAIKANNETAERFQDWVTSEVLPSIRQHGAYLTDQKIEEVLTNPDTIIRLATELKEERQAKLVLKQQNSVLLQQNNELKPKADYTDLILSNKTLVTITFIAKDYGMSGTAMNKLLHDLGVQYNQSGIWLLYAKHQKKGWTQSETHEVTRKDGTKKIVANTKWTQKGRLGLYDLLKANGYLPLIEQDIPA
ncbi:phage antirepressor KilAC domain-containing protein [Leuconostoc mesenteroides]|uniref:phage antirepressor KilAC domain-containing protein n=1 Tax=Leuconostoc mesenteroides TaxID=1245 RepID=UPI0009FD897A|nr:phage antirepressor KilAC domain-containing protein [Leuconostoc mesenteroides]ORI39390.1 phage repressor protein/antirepressor Ant [Leuconostoc mesenteroides subsp. cremoris]ORI40795.1 phage repressor protein/antirepressor Ant [Leuconostoc mesenteroides subsp. cremoris]